MAASSSSADSDPLKPCWQPGQPVPFVFLSRIWKMIEGENGRIKITNWLAFAFWQILAYTPADLPAALFLSSDQLAPSYQNHQLGIGGSTLVRLVCEITSVSHAKISADHARLGDLGLIAAQYRLTQTLLFRPAPLTVAHVFSTFHALGDVSKRDRKEMMLVTHSATCHRLDAADPPTFRLCADSCVHAIVCSLLVCCFFVRCCTRCLQKKLFAAAREDELLYLIRVAEGSLRIGAVITTVLSALAKAFVLHHLYCEGVASERHWEACSFERVLKATEAVRGAKPGPFVLEEPLRVDASPAARSACIARRLPSYLARATAKLRRAYAELPSFHDILPVLLASSTNIYDLHNHIRLTAGVPIKPQLGRAVTSVMQVLKLFRGMAFTVECKYDGLRAQIHRLSNGTYRIFSRHLMDQGNRWDDLVPLIEAAIMRPDDTQTFIIDAEIVAIQHMAQTVANGSASAAAAAAAASSASASADCSTDAATSAAAPSPSFRILPFQQLATRKRKGDSSTAPLTAEKRVEVSCMVYAFDFLSLNGESLLLRSLPERRALMAETFAERSGEFQFVEHCDISAASASNIVIEELDEEEENEAKIKPRAKAKAKASAKAKPTSLKGAIAAAAVAADAAEEQGSDDDEGSDVEEIDGAGAGSATRADADDELASLQPPAEAKADESAVEASPSGSTPVISDALKSDAVAAAPSASEQIAEFMRTVAIPRGEGIMAKSLTAHSTYEPDVRTDQWCKLKRDYMGGMGVADSIDVVIIGAWHGNGRKAGWLSPFLAAVYNPDNDEYESFAKIMTGFTDAVYKQFTEECMELAVPAPPRYYRVSDSLRPTIWFKPKKVWEIRGADLTISPVHAAARGLVHESRVRVKHNDQCRRVRIALSQPLISRVSCCFLTLPLLAALLAIAFVRVYLSAFPVSFASVRTRASNSARLRMR